MGTNVYQGRTTVSELRDLIRKLGGSPKGNTKAQLQDELEAIVSSGGGSGSVSPAELRAAVEAALDEKLPAAIAEAIETGGLTDEEVNDLFEG